MIRAMIRMANRIDAKRYPYRWGGGHNASFSGPYDCSGAVSAVLRAAGLVDRPMVSGEYMRWGAPGKGAVTIYANAGHVYMSILGRFFGTTGMNPAAARAGSRRSARGLRRCPRALLEVQVQGQDEDAREEAGEQPEEQRQQGHRARGDAAEPGGHHAAAQHERRHRGSLGTSTTTATGPRQASTDTVQGTVAPAPNPAAVEQVRPVPAPAAPTGPAPSPTTQVPSAPAPAPAAPPVTGTGGGPSTPNPAPPTQAPAAPKPPAPSTRLRQRRRLPSLRPRSPACSSRQRSRPSPTRPPAQRAAGGGQVGQQVGGAAPSTQPPKPPAGQGQGSAPNSGQ